MKSLYLVSVVIDIPLNQSFTYLSEVQLDLGTRVLVEFGFTNKKIVGFVWDDAKLPEAFDQSKLKSILQVFDQKLDPSTVDLVRFVAKYYHCPIGVTLFSAIPTALRRAKEINVKTYNTKSTKITKSSLTKSLKLNLTQQEIVEQIQTKFNQFYPAVIHGVTGSGKTETYLSLVEQVVGLGKQALILVPEINLTPGLCERFESYFPKLNITILTSHVTEARRLQAYMGVQSGELQILIGTRVAVFSPFKNLGLIVVDEEHDQSFKQDDGLCYHARDIAVLRAKTHNVPIVLCSATPSLETLHNCELGRYHLYKMPHRAVALSKLPKIKLVDLNHDQELDHGLSTKAKALLESTLNNKELALVFINRRGYSPVVSCFGCGYTIRCRNCSTNMVYHAITRKLKCHHCGFNANVPKACPKCNNPDLRTIGMGTQRIEEVLANHFPQAKIVRIDQDSVNTRNKWLELYDQINHHQIDILVGTQMLAKGHDFHNLTLVIGLDIDNSLFSYDFRAQELLYTQLTQVSGRAGRGSKEGIVLLQTRYPTHPLYQYLVRDDFDGFASYLLNERKLLNLPPYSFYTIIRASAPKLQIAIDYLSKFYQIGMQIKFAGVTIYPPVSAVISRIKNKERAQLLIQANSKAQMQNFLEVFMSKISEIKRVSNVNLLIDVDPLDL